MSNSFWLQIIKKHSKSFLCKFTWRKLYRLDRVVSRGCRHPFLCLVMWWLCKTNTKCLLGNSVGEHRINCWNTTGISIICTGISLASSPQFSRRDNMSPVVIRLFIPRCISWNIHTFIFGFVCCYYIAVVNRFVLFFGIVSLTPRQPYGYISASDVTPMDTVKSTKIQSKWNHSKAKHKERIVCKCLDIFCTSVTCSLPHCMGDNICRCDNTCVLGSFLSLARSKLRLCSANHRAGYFSNLPCDWLSIVWAFQLCYRCFHI